MPKTVVSRLVHDICDRVERRPDRINRNRRTWRLTDNGFEHGCVELDARKGYYGEVIVGLYVFDPRRLRPGDRLRDASQSMQYQLLEEGEQKGSAGLVNVRYDDLVKVVAATINMRLAESLYQPPSKREKGR